jgi:hypothetical protein
VLHAACAAAEQTVALVDSTKFGNNSLLTIASISDLDRLIVDEGVVGEVLGEYERAGVNVIVAGASSAGAMAARARAPGSNGRDATSPDATR